MKKTIVLLSVPLAMAANGAITVNGRDIPSEGLPLLATQDTPTGFGNATGGGQNSAGGSELNQIFGSISGGTLELGITGNLEGNFNKMFIFFDAVSGGESTLLNDNADGGFGEINNLAGLSFSGGFTADHGIRIEVGNGFWGINGFNTISNTAFSIASGGGFSDLPVSATGSGGVTVGWDNSNVLGVSDTSAATANTATTGWEFSIDMATFFGATPSEVGVTAFVANAGADFISNQVLPGIGGGGNLGTPSSATIDSVLVVPEPSAALLGSLGLLGLLRRRRA